MSTLAPLCLGCHHKFVDGAYKYCPMCGTRRLPFPRDGSSTVELEVEPHRVARKPHNLPIPTYEQIYVHHPRSLKEKGKLYGKKFLLTYYFDEYHKYLNNQQKAKVWLKEDGFLDENQGRSREEWRAALKATCEVRSKQMELLDFEKIQMPWRPKEIYNYLLEHTKNLNKYNKSKRKRATEMSSRGIADPEIEDCLLQLEAAGPQNVENQIEDESNLQPPTHEEDFESQLQRRLRRKSIEGDSRRKKRNKGKALAQDDENTDDLKLKEAELTIKRHFNYKRVDDIESHIDAAIDQLNIVEETIWYSKWKKYEYRKKVIKVAQKLNEN